MKANWDFWKRLAVSFGFANSAVFYYTFVIAYTSSAKQVIVDINSYGEAHIEMILFSIIMVFITIHYFIAVWGRK